MRASAKGCLFFISLSFSCGWVPLPTAGTPHDSLSMYRLHGACSREPRESEVCSVSRGSSVGQVVEVRTGRGAGKMVPLRPDKVAKLDLSPAWLGRISREVGPDHKAQGCCGGCRVMPGDRAPMAAQSPPRPGPASVGVSRPPPLAIMARSCLPIRL